jgi:serine/threonine protein phosphatase PrpC
VKIGEQAALTDPGRKRRRNEDSFVVEPPLFVVADGMGGAQAGEVASRLAAASFREFHEADELEPEPRLEAIIQEANRRIFERARHDTGLSGMGTTVTAALLGESAIAIGHVGDSRAYRIREGELEQLTQDHSLVADLIRSGRLTPEEAEDHPQRSVITRALGTDPDVDVDTFLVEARPGDLFLICSDGLTSMVPEEEILETLRGSPGLEQAARTLVKAANKQGGEDNITVILFRLESGESLDDTLVAGNGHGEADDLEDTLTGLEPLPAVDAAHWEDVTEPAGQEPVTSPASGRPRKRRGLLWALVAFAVLAILVGGAFLGLSRAYFVGAEDDGRVAVYQGVPWDLGGGARLYRARYVSQLQAAQLSPEERASLFDHSLTSYDEARDRIAPYEEEATP